MNTRAAIVQINRGLEQYAQTFTTESDEYIDLEFRLSRLLGTAQVRDRKYGAVGYSRSKSALDAYDPAALSEALKLVQGHNTAAAQAQSYYRALEDAGAKITQENVRLLSKNLNWILEHKDEIYATLLKEYGNDWGTSRTAWAWANSDTNTPEALYAVFARDAEYRAEKNLDDEPMDFFRNIDRIREKLKLSTQQQAAYARKRREASRQGTFTPEEMKQWREMRDNGLF